MLWCTEYYDPHFVAHENRGLFLDEDAEDMPSSKGDII